MVSPAGVSRSSSKTSCKALEPSIFAAQLFQSRWEKESGRRAQYIPLKTEHSLAYNKNQQKVLYCSLVQAVRNKARSRFSSGRGCRDAIGALIIRIGFRGP